MNQVPDDVIERDVCFLHTVYAGCRHCQAKIEQAFGMHSTHSSSIAACKTDGYELHPPRSLKSMHEVLRVAAGRNGKQYIAFTAERNDLAREDIGKPDIVCHCRDHCYVVVQTDHRESFAADGDRMHELDGKMLGVGGRAAVATNEYPVPVMESQRQLQCNLNNCLLLICKESAFHPGAFLRLLDQR